MEYYAPIGVFVFKKLIPLKFCIESLKLSQLASKSDLIIYSDGWRNLDDKIEINEIRKFIRSIKGFKSIKIIELHENLGLAK